MSALPARLGSTYMQISYDLVTAMAIPVCAGLGACIGVLAVVDGQIAAHRRRRGISNSGASLVGILFHTACIAAGALIGTTVVVSSAAEIRWSRLSTGWTAVPAQVQSTSAAFAWRKTFRIAIHYRYVVDGRAYDASRVQFGQEGATSLTDDPDTWLRNYPPGVTVTAYVDPASPQRAVLQPGRHIANVYWLMAEGFGPLLVSVRLFWLWQREGKLSARPRGA